MVLGDHSGQPTEQITGDRGHNLGRFVRVRLFVAKPHDLRGDVGGIGVETGSGEHPVHTHLVGQVLGLGRGPSIQPDDACAKRGARSVDGDHAVDLTGKAKVTHRCWMQACGCCQLADDLLYAVLPRRRCLVRPARSEIGHGAGGTCHTEDLRLGRKQDAFHALGSDIDADDVAQLGSFCQPDCGVAELVLKIIRKIAGPSLRLSA